MIKHLISRAALWADRRRGGDTTRRHDDPRLDRYIEASLSDEALAWAVGTWSKRYR